MRWCSFGTQCNAKGALKVSYRRPGISEFLPGAPNPTQQAKEKRQNQRKLGRGQDERKIAIEIM